MTEEKRIEIYKGLTGEVVFDVDAEGETIWATQAQIAQLFGVDRTVVGRHLRNVFNTGELDETVVCAKNAHTTKHGAMSDKTQVREVKIYNLDAIISVGYRVNSKKATQFRIWATTVLKRYLSDGVAVNERRLKAIAEKRELKKLHDVEDVMALVRRLTARNELDAGEANGVLEVISRYAGSFKTLEEYDDGHIDLHFMNNKRKGRELTIEVCDRAVEQLRASVGGSELFGKKRGKSFDGSLAAIFQSFNQKELYPSVPEKAANLLYFIIKDHPFYDGNKRIGSLLFILFLTMNDCQLTDKGETKISDRALTAIALLIAESEPKEKDLIVSLVCKLLE
ncbi:virulence protein RhuM/Fic/DOC family protein [Candidatus Saccharibacteria bacterium]|nr:virulence protein RhuM/Fic/DOC family protein [Candidatus Saccharibacteria bacterium]